MTVSQMRLMKSETRDMADFARASGHRLRPGSSDEWQMSNATFLTAFCVIAGVIAVLALVLRVIA
jgi:hypothetical protein